MGIAADSLFNVLMSWVRGLVNAIWALFSADHTTALEFLGKNWMAIAAVIIICGLVIDWIVWLIRWQPYHLWARRARRLLRLDEPDEEETKEKGKAHAARAPESRYARPQKQEERAEPEMYLYDGDEDEAPEWLDQQEEIPDETFSAYPGRRYSEQLRYSRSYAAMTQEETDMTGTERGPVEDALERLQEEARMRAEAERAERARLEREAREAEQARLAQEAYEAEQARLAQEAYEAEQARLAQEEYARQMEEYERQKAQYERDLAEYERQKAAYEAQLAQQQAYEEQLQTMRVTDGAARRRRTAVATQDEQAQVIERPAGTRPKQTAGKAQKAASGKGQKAKASGSGKANSKHEEKADKGNALLSRVAKMIEPEEEEIVSRKTLPPRVDMNDAFRTAKLPVVTPPGNGRRKR